MSVVGFAHGAFSDGGGGGPESVQSPIAAMAANPDLIPIYLLIASPYDPGAGATTTVYYSTAPFTSGASDSPSLQVFTEDKIAGPLDLRNNLSLRAGTLDAQGTSAGDVVFSTIDPAARVDELAGYLWDGRDVQVLIGFEGYTLAECAEVFHGTAEGVRWDRDAIYARLRSPRFKLERDIQTTTYAGSGGAEGGDALKGKPKPLLYGQVRQFEPVLVDGTNLVYQAHAGVLQAVNAVRDRGLALNFDADYASYAALVAATIPAGEYGTCLAEGLIRLGASPDGVVTGDFQGDKSGSLGASGYTSTAADIIRKIATTKGALSDPGDLEIGSFDDLNAATSAVVGIATRLEPVKVAAVLDRVAGAAGAFLDFTRTGRLKVVRLVDPTTATATDTITSVEPSSFRGASADVPAHTIKLGHRPYWKTLNGEEVATSVADATRFDYGEELRFVTAEDEAAVTALHPSASVYEVPTLLDASADADAEAARLLALYKPSRHVYQVDAYSKLFAYELGDVVELEVPRYDLTSGKKFVVIGIREAPWESGEHVNKVSLVLWGREN